MKVKTSAYVPLVEVIMDLILQHMNPLKWLEEDIHIDMSMCIRMRVSISWILKLMYQSEIVKHVCWKWIMYSNQSLHFMLYYIFNESMRGGWLFYSLNSPTKPAWKAKDKSFWCISWFHWKTFRYIISNNTGRNNNGMSIERYKLWTWRRHVAF